LENLEPWIDYNVILQKLHTEHPNDPCLGLSSAERTEQVKAAYYQAIRQSGLMTNQARLLSSDSNNNNKSPCFVYTAMHGVGLEAARRIFQEFGLPPFHSVESQEQPDPTFPTVAFPNPEEKGALDLAKAYAEQRDCDVVLANDPDADRLAVAERDRETNEWTVFTGDQIGTMLGHWLWESVGKKSDKVGVCWNVWCILREHY
jgi:phosphomannomutase